MESNGIEAKWKKRFLKYLPKYPVHEQFDECVFETVIDSQENKISLHFLAWNFHFFLVREMEINCQWDSERKITWTGVSYLYLCMYIYDTTVEIRFLDAAFCFEIWEEPEMDRIP